MHPDCTTPRQSSVVTGTCERCGKAFTTRRAKAQTAPVRFCGWECYRSPQIDRTCKTCGQPFQVAEWKVKQGKGRFCSKACNARKTTLICKTCGKTFQVMASRASRQYCSRACTRTRPFVPLAERFWAKVRKTDGCWEWVGGKSTGGYGAAEDPRGKLTSAHRVSWELTYGEDPGDSLVCHHCDNPACVRPDHLFLGTQADNMADMIRKGRRIEACHREPGQLTAEAVRAIRARYSDGETQTQLAREFGVSRPMISVVVNRKRWKNLD